MDDRGDGRRPPEWTESVRLMVEAVHAGERALAQLAAAGGLPALSPEQERRFIAWVAFDVTNPDGDRFAAAARYLVAYHPTDAWGAPRALFAYRLLERGWCWRPAAWVARLAPLWWVRRVGVFVNE